MNAFLDLLIALPVAGCVLRFAYRFAFEGAERMKQPPQYERLRYQLNIWAAIGLLAATFLLWWQVSWWIAATWIFIDFIAEWAITRHGERRFIAQIMDLWRKIDPSLTPSELKMKAIDKLKFEKSEKAEYGGYL